jgi:hypothetical protein
MSQILMWSIWFVLGTVDILLHQPTIRTFFLHDHNKSMLLLSQGAIIITKLEKPLQQNNG